MKRLYNHYFPTPPYLAMRAFAFDISDKSIKYGELVASSYGLKLGRYGREKIPEGVIVSGKIEKENELIVVLKKIKEKENLHFVRVSLPEEQMYLFTLSILKTKDENIRDMILLQIEEYIPLKALDVVFDYDVVSETEKNILIEVVAISGAMMESYLSVFNRAGLVPLSFEIEAQAIARAVIPVGDNSPIMIVDFGDTRTGVSISKNGRVFLTTTLSIGGVDLTNMIAKNFSLSFDEAEKMKHEYGLNEISKIEDIFPAILNGISILRDELNKQYIYWENHNSINGDHEQINHIILCGGDANLAGLSEYLELSMKIKVENANVWVNVLENNNSIPEMSFEESLSYATVLGLALGSFDFKSKPIINVLPVNESMILRKEYWMRFSTVVFNLISVMGVIAIVLLFPTYFISQEKEKIVESQLEFFNKDNPDLIINNIDETIKDVNLKLEILNKNKVAYLVSDKIINTILNSRTPNIKFSQILFSKKNEGSFLEIHGVAENRDSLRNFKASLDANQNFSSVSLPISSFLEKTNLIFTISIILK